MHAFSPPRWLLLALWLFCAAGSAYAHDAALTVYPFQSRISLNAHWQFLPDPTANLSIDDVMHRRFEPLTKRNLGYSQSAYWLKVTLQAPPSQPSSAWLLAFYWPVIDQLDVWVAQSQHRKHYALGDHRPYHNRPVKSSLPAVPIQMVDHDPVTVYVRMESTSALLTLAELWRTEDFMQEDKQRDITYGFYFGMMAMVCLVFLLLGSWLRSLAFLSYSAYVLGFGILAASLNGYVNVYFPAAQDSLSDWVVGLSSLTLLGFALVMNMQLLQTQHHHPVVHRIFQLGVLFSILAMPFAAGHYYYIVAQVVLLQMVFICTFALVQSVRIFINTRRLEAAFYFLAFMQLSLYGLIYALMMLNLMDVDYEYGMRYQNAIFASILCMSMGMAYRVRQIELDKAQAQAMAAHIQQRAQEERRFVAMLSHEFRNPLAAIDRSAQMLHYTVQKIDEVVLTRVNNIRASVSRLSSLVDNFLLSERIESGHLQLELKQHDLADLLADIRMHMTEADWLRIRHDCDDGHFIFDLGMMSMAVGNLLHNALRYAYPETAVNLRVGVIPQGLSIIVSDAGPGISQEDLAMLGVPYYRMRQAVGKKGTGLGYYFCKRIVELHGGTLSARLNEAGGLEVTIQCLQPLI